MKKYSTAITVLVAVVVLGTLFGTHRSLSGLRKDAAEAFYQGADGSGYGISTNLDLRVEYARNFCKIAARYDAAAEISQVEAACEALEAADRFDDLYDANNRLTDAVNALSLQLEQQTLSESDERYRKSLTADLASYEMRIDKLASDFNAEVRSFNRYLDSFPAGILGRLVGIGNLEEYS